MIGLLTLIMTFLGYKIKRLSVSGANAFMTKSRKTDTKLAWGLMGVSSVFLVGLTTTQFTRIRDQTERQVTDAAVDAVIKVLPGLPVAYVLYYMLKRNQWNLCRVATDAMQLLRAAERHSRQPVSTLFSPSSRSLPPPSIKSDSLSHSICQPSLHGDR